MPHGPLLPEARFRAALLVLGPAGANVGKSGEMCGDHVEKRKGPWDLSQEP